MRLDPARCGVMPCNAELPDAVLWGFWSSPGRLRFLTSGTSSEDSGPASSSSSAGSVLASSSWAGEVSPLEGPPLLVSVGVFFPLPRPFWGFALVAEPLAVPLVALADAGCFGFLPPRARVVTGVTSVSIFSAFSSFLFLEGRSTGVSCGSSSAWDG